MELVIESAVNPLDIRINTRYKSGHHVPPQVREAVLRLIGDTKDAITSQSWTCPDGPVEVDFDFYFPTYRGDLDGPLKRGLDAVTRGVKESGFPRFDDGRVVALTLRRHRADREGGDARIRVRVRPSTAQVAIKPEHITRGGDWTMRASGSYGRKKENA